MVFLVMLKAPDGSTYAPLKTCVLFNSLAWSSFRYGA